jgi:hypothetical protein
MYYHELKLFTMKYLSFKLLLLSLFVISCSSMGTTADAQKKTVSQFSRAGLCDLLIDKNGVCHAVFQESPAIGKPTFIYYASSADKGASWSKPITLSNDMHGNGSGYARILQDGKGVIYAIWKRYGNTESEYPVQYALLDGPGGGISGTIFYKVLSGGQWSAPIQLNELEETQESWFATVAPNGVLYVVWAQDNPATLKYSRQNWKYADYVRGASLSGTTHSAYSDMTKPIQPGGPGLSFPARQEGKIDLDGYIDKTGVLHLIYAVVDEKGVERIVYSAGNKPVVVYSYPAYAATNSWVHPPRLLVDDKGIDHLIMLPSPATLESEQLWDENLATKNINILASIQQQGVTISGFQAKQGPNGAMAVTFEAQPHGGNGEGYGTFYENGSWKNVGLTNNAAKEKFFYKDFGVVNGYRTVASTLTRYNSKFMSVAYDAAGHKTLLMNLEAYSVGYGISNPDIIFIAIDR